MSKLPWLIFKLIKLPSDIFKVPENNVLKVSSLKLYFNPFDLIFIVLSAVKIETF